MAQIKFLDESFLSELKKSGVWCPYNIFHLTFSSSFNSSRRRGMHRQCNLMHHGNPSIRTQLFVHT